MNVYPQMLPFFIKRQTWLFHVVVLLTMAKKWTKLKKRTYRAYKPIVTFSLPSPLSLLKLPNTEFKIYDATITKTSFKIASSGLLIFFVFMSVCLTSRN